MLVYELPFTQSDDGFLRRWANVYWEKRPVSKVILVFVNCATKQEASDIAEQVLSQRLAASTNLYPEITSSYWWNGNTEQREEYPLVLKTTEALFAPLAEVVERLHSYETPSIVAVAADHISSGYQAWLQTQVRSDKGSVN